MDDLLTLFHMEMRTADRITDDQIFEVDFKDTDRIIARERERIRRFLLKIREGEKDA